MAIEKQFSSLHGKKKKQELETVQKEG